MAALFATRRLDRPRDLRVLAALEAVGAGRSTVQLPVMSTSFRDDLRAQLVAVAPRLVEEGVRPGTETAPRPAATAARRRSSATSGLPARSPTRTRTRPMTVLVAGAAIVVLGLGGATWLARGALPGDALYGLKRTAEGVDVSLSGSDLDKGHAQLISAQNRVEEVADLIKRPQSMSLGTGTFAASGALSNSTVKLIVSTLQTADTDTRQGITTIGNDAIKRDDHAGLDLAVAWAQGQSQRIDVLVERIESPASARKQALTSQKNIEAGLTRAERLQKDYRDKTCQRDRDEFGLTPCLVPGSTTPNQPSSTAPTTGSPGSTGPSPSGTGGGRPASSPPSGPSSSPTR